MKNHIYIIILLLLTGCSRSLWPLSNYSGYGSGQWFYQLNYQAPGPIVLDNEVHEIPMIQINLRAIPQSYTIINRTTIIFKYKFNQSIIVSYNYDNNKELYSEICNAANIEIDNRRIQKSDTFGKIEVYYLNIKPQNVALLENVVVKIESPN